MTQKTNAQDVLKVLWYLEKQVRAKHSELLRIDSLLSISSKHSDINVQTSKSNNTEDALVNAADLIAEIQATIAKIVKKRHEITTLIDSLEKEPHRVVLRERYLNGKIWDEVAIDLRKSNRHTRRLHKEAIEEFQKIIDKTHYN